MFEKVNPSHPDKIADRIAGAIVDVAYTMEERPKIAVEVMIGHSYCYVTVESSVEIPTFVVNEIVKRIAGEYTLVYICVPQDKFLAKNQKEEIRCGDNGIFKGMPVTDEQKELCNIAGKLYKHIPYDGKYILDENSHKLIVCQSNAMYDYIQSLLHSYPYDKVINPLGNWIGGPESDTGCTNRKLGSDMGDSITGGGLFGKDASKADVSVNIYAWLKAQETGEPQEFYCAIGDKEVNGIPYAEIVDVALDYIKKLGGFEKFAEWGLISPDNI